MRSCTITACSFLLEAGSRRVSRLFERNQRLYEEKWRESWVPQRQRANATADS